jgi:hypothetical protein
MWPWQSATAGATSGEILTTSTLHDYFDYTMGYIGGTFANILPYILAVVAILIALVFGWKWVRRTIGRSK